jgi:hypothetical protein
MSIFLPQKYEKVAKELIPYQATEGFQKLGLIKIEPALPCVLCNGPATEAIIAPAPDQVPGTWLTFPICSTCEERQIRTEGANPAHHHHE